jgi:transcriptional regulator GlxA family with amidase domain
MMAAMAIRQVAAVAPQGVTALSLGMVSGIFAKRSGVPDWDFAICTSRPGPLVTDLGLPLVVENGLELLSVADLVILLPGEAFRAELDEELSAALQAAHQRGATIAAHCVGVFALAAAGLADGRVVTTHWHFADELAARYPSLTVDAGALYIDEGDVVTGAGASAGIDMCLHLVRREHGAAVANLIARALVTPPHRDGGQAQFAAAPLAMNSDDERLAGVIAWARGNLDQRITIDRLAARALMSKRSFARHFRAATGAAPHAWVRAQRFSLAEELLETTDLTVQQIAKRIGYGNPAVFREQFVARRGVAPRDYRRTFTRAAPEDP